MSSNARILFDENARDIVRLLEFHKHKGGIAKGRRYGLEVLNKSAIVLLTSFWEAYCEDIAGEALEHLVAHARTADKLPVELRKLVAKELKSERHELAVWRLSGTGWRAVLKRRLASLQAERNRRLNTPKTAQIDDLFLKALGISKVSDSWHWPKKMTVARATAKLDRYVELRGAIAHRGAAAGTVRKVQVTDYFKFLKRLVGQTGGAVCRHVRTVTSVKLWK
jgi:hypothetical protein